MKGGGRSPYRLAPNLFSICFGVAGLAEAWTVAGDSVGAPSWPRDVLWISSAVLWLVTVVAYFRNVIGQGRLRGELPDVTTGPFVSVIVIVPMLYGVALAPHARVAGKTVFLVFLVLTFLLGGWITGLWIRVDTRLEQWHPGYFLPTVAGGFIAAGGCGAFGYTTLGHVLFGYGLVCWFILGSILLVRLFTQPMLPPPLVPTIAIELAPPVVGGNAWFALNGGRLDTVAALLAGYAALMVLVQLSLFTLYRSAPFGPGYWAFAFSYASALTDGLDWLGIEHVHGRDWLTYLFLALGTAALLALAYRTAVGLIRGTFLPRLG